MVRQKKSLVKFLGLWVAPFVGLAGLAVALMVYFHTPRQRSHNLTLTAGQTRSTRNQMAQALQDAATTYGIHLQMQPSHGSEEALDLVNRGKLDLALVQGGLCTDERPNVRQVATLNIEPLHLLVKKELLESVSASLNALDGKSVNLGQHGSGTYSLAQEVMAFAGLQPKKADGKSGYMVTTLGRDELYAAKDRSSMPDAIFVVSLLPSEVGKYLINERDYRLVPLPFSEAFSLDGLVVMEGGHVRPSRNGHIVKGRVQGAVIPAFTYQVQPPVPASAMPALGTRLLLVAHKDVDPDAVQKLVDAVYATEFATVTRPPLDTKLLDLPPEFPWHAGTKTYLDRSTPVVSGMVIDSAHKGIAIFAAAASGLFVLWQWLKLRTQFLRDRGFAKYLSKVSYIEETVNRVEHDEIGSLAHLHELRDELAAMKSEALARFTEGELSGHELLEGFLVQVNYVRANIRDLVLHYERTRPAAEPVEQTSK